MASALSSSSLLTFFFLLSITSAKEFLVGGNTTSWKIPSSQSESLNQWAESCRFRVGDTLVWKYVSEKDSVLQVTKKAYLSCNATSPVAEYKQSNNGTKIRLEKPGAIYFVSGAKGNCEKGEKLIVVVMSHKFVAVSPAPAPAGFDGPAVAPTSGAARLMGGALCGVVFVFWVLWEVVI